MGEALREMTDAFNHPQMRHAIVVHWPVVLSVLLIPLTFLAALLPSNKTCRWFALAAGAMLVAAAFVATNSGENAHSAMSGQGTPVVNELVDRHEEMAEKLWIFASVITVLIAVSAFVKPMLRMACLWLAVALSAAAAGWVAYTAHLGGTLVYREGVGAGTGTSAATTRSAATAPATRPRSTSSDPKVAFFEDTVVPILADHCLKCHNPQQARRKGGLDLTTHDAALKGGKSRPAIVPGKPEESYLIDRVRHLSGDPDDDPMPPPPNPLLTEEQIQAIEQWIRDGAAWGGTPSLQSS